MSSSYEDRKRARRTVSRDGIPRTEPRRDRRGERSVYEDRGSTRPGVFTQDQMAAMGGGGEPVVLQPVLKFSPGTEWLSKFVQVELESTLRRAARSGSRGLPGRGGGMT